MRYYIIAGEASGDLHGANLLKELNKLDSSAVFRAWGGDLMKGEGADLVKHYRDLAFMGFSEVIQNLRTILGNIAFCKKDILAYKPDVLILIDYPGFNLRIAEFAHEQGIKVFYYISPQIWAWKQSRVHKIKKFVDRMFVILPFEKEFYARFAMNVDFVGHPLLDSLEQKRNSFSSLSDFRNKHKLSAKPIIALLPGSRKQEVRVMLPLMLSVKESFPDYQFVIAGAPSLLSDFYKEVSNDPSVKMISDVTYELIYHAEAALVTSGTATLETALLGTPEVVCYKGGKISYAIARSLIKVKYISLVNLIMDKLIVTELIQDKLNTKNIISELKSILETEARTKMLNEYSELLNKLGGSGASAKTAELMIKYLKG
ncbi:MAG: lipid-A-disaccharide synthase [Bacteroidetes bacterium]|nr:MAG: lipid-A-disaccharide synthase [Bacteroidota bacterium]